MQYWRKFPTKLSYRPFQTKTFYYIFLCLFAFSFIACNQSNSIRSTKGDEGAKLSAHHISFDTLSVLYIENNVLKALLDPPRPPQKLIFEFFKTRTDTITLLTWGETNAARDLENKFPLKVGSEQRYLDTHDKNVIIGSIEISGTTPNSDLKRLKDTLDLPNPHKYILFEPVVVQCDEPNCTKDDYVIKYKLWGSDTTLIDAPQKFATASDLTLSPNPSPPARRL